MRTISRILGMNCYESDNAKHDYSCVLAELPEDLARRVFDLGLEKISNSDLYTEEEGHGREDHIHVTVKYGLLEQDPSDELTEIVENFPRFRMRLGRISLFTDPEDFDVVKIDVSSPELEELNKMISGLPNEDKHDFHPHCTIAYVKKGTCSNLVGLGDLEGEEFEVSKLRFSNADKDKKWFNLAESVVATADKGWLSPAGEFLPLDPGEAHGDYKESLFAQGIRLTPAQESWLEQHHNETGKTIEFDHYTSGKIVRLFGESTPENIVSSLLNDYKYGFKIV